MTTNLPKTVRIPTELAEAIGHILNDWRGWVGRCGHLKPADEADFWKYIKNLPEDCQSSIIN